MTADRVREIVAAHARLAVDVATLADGDDLYSAGLTSHASVNLMLALEDAFDIEFPERLLRRQTFESIPRSATPSTSSRSSRRSRGVATSAGPARSRRNPTMWFARPPHPRTNPAPRQRSEETNRHADERQRVVPCEPCGLDRTGRVRDRIRCGPEASVGEQRREVAILDEEAAAFDLWRPGNVAPGEIEMLRAHDVDAGRAFEQPELRRRPAGCSRAAGSGRRGGRVANPCRRSRSSRPGAGTRSTPPRALDSRRPRVAGRAEVRGQDRYLTPVKPTRHSERASKYPWKIQSSATSSGMYSCNMTAPGFDQVAAASSSSFADRSGVDAPSSGNSPRCPASATFATTGNVASLANASMSASEVGNAAPGVEVECARQSSRRPRLLASLRGRSGGTGGQINHGASSDACSATSTAASSSVATTTAGRPTDRAIETIRSSRYSSPSRPVVGATMRRVR